jgi:hypothetical protein
MGELLPIICMGIERMKTLNMPFTDQEFAKLTRAKGISKRNWHDFVLCLVWVGVQPEEVKT